MSLSRFERENHDSLALSENGSQDFVLLAQDADLEYLAKITDGKYASNTKGEIILWNNDFSLKREIVNRHTGEKKLYLKTRSGREEISDYGIVMKQNYAAIIYPINPVSHTIGGLEIAEGDYELIAGNQSKFPSSYQEARKQSYQARINSLQAR